MVISRVKIWVYAHELLSGTHDWELRFLKDSWEFRSDVREHVVIIGELQGCRVQVEACTCENNWRVWVEVSCKYLEWRLHTCAKVPVRILSVNTCAARGRVWKEDGESFCCCRIEESGFLSSGLDSLSTANS